PNNTSQSPESFPDLKFPSTLQSTSTTGKLSSIRPLKLRLITILKLLQQSCRPKWIIWLKDCIPGSIREWTPRSDTVPKLMARKWLMLSSNGPKKTEWDMKHTSEYTIQIISHQEEKENGLPLIPITCLLCVLTGVT